ncbi:PTS system, mannitol-specific IIA component/PTS system, ascorbate-specific IIA component [Evansella caseinilytica]|uniref:PTS system, mannitol-specific IIA component/PTS system, ascorbate-specific IIA component n=1 Tax=Evansella caseinilytica TaxID=1503961 RepID=A0A1H3UG57_9BACI|nr:PTS sugar transporter subunit IIA [Evansella caseinilytica]SDZ61368.1 PTS system, mannitol-specific IIA component/PTS system, ascorbate-specific IIA component [Evansella caseinilytica]
MKFLEKQLVRVRAEAVTAEEAISLAGQLLVDDGVAEAAYVAAMVRSYQQNGPYFVVAPNIAIPHARPEDGVKEASVSFLQLKEPLLFGHTVNDPVQLIFCLGASSSEEHVALLKKLTLLLNNPDNVNKLSLAAGYTDVENILKGGM